MRVTLKIMKGSRKAKLQPDGTNDEDPDYEVDGDDTPGSSLREDKTLSQLLQETGLQPPPPHQQQAVPSTTGVPPQPLVPLQPRKRGRPLKTHPQTDHQRAEAFTASTLQDPPPPENDKQPRHTRKKYRLSPCTDNEPLPVPFQSSMCNPRGTVTQPANLGGTLTGPAIPEGTVSQPANLGGTLTGSAIPGGTVTIPVVAPFGIKMGPITPSYIPGDDVMLEELLREAAELTATSKEGIPQQYQRVNDWFDR